MNPSAIKLPRKMPGVSLTLLLMLTLLPPLHASISFPDVTVTSPPSESEDDSPTTAHCPADYSMIDCRLSNDSSYKYSDGLKFDENSCTAYAGIYADGNSVKVNTDF